MSDKHLDEPQLDENTYDEDEDQPTIDSLKFKIESLEEYVEELEKEKKELNEDNKKLNSEVLQLRQSITFIDSLIDDFRAEIKEEEIEAANAEDN